MKYTIKGSNSKEMLLELTYKGKLVNRKVVIFSHGFKGFKDWGCFPLVSRYFAENNFVFINFNFSHNGTTLDNPTVFDDLESFGNNNFSKELFDLNKVIDFVYDKIKNPEITLLGHSRGGGISILKSSIDPRVKKIVSWASPSNFLNRMDEERINLWKEKGVIYVYNGRTKQNMPMYLQFYEDCIKNRDQLDIRKAVISLTIPQLIVHGDSDSTVLVDEAKDIHKWNSSSVLCILNGADHVFGASHPYNTNTLPPDMQFVVEKTINFINQ